MSVVYGLGAVKMQMMIMSGALLNGLCLRTFVRYIACFFLLTVILKCKLKSTDMQLLLLTPKRRRSTCMTLYKSMLPNTDAYFQKNGHMQGLGSQEACNARERRILRQAQEKASQNENSRTTFLQRDSALVENEVLLRSSVPV